MNNNNEFETNHTQEWETPSTEESLNWISYNLKRIADIMQQHTGYKKPQKDQSFENNRYRK